MAMIHLEPQTAQMFSRALGALKPPPNLTLSQWADNYRRLSAEASAAQGRWNTDNAPFQREIMDAIGDVHIRKVVAMMCAQSGKTDGLILNTIGYYMSYYPAPIMIVQPTVNLGESFSKDRLATMIRDTPVLRGLVDNKSRYSGNTIMKKNFAGGQLTIVGANAPTDLRGRPIKVLLADEVDAYKASAGKEGDPVMLAEQRQTTYWDYKTVLVSTPTDKNNSRILDEFNASTQEEWTVPCPNCGFYQPFVWDNMVFDKDKWPEGGVQYRCAECGCLDNEYRWKKNSVQGRWHAEHPERSVRGFHMNKIGSTLCGWDKIVEDFIAADLDRRAVARTALSVINNGTGYGNYGASHTSRSMRSWHVGGGSAKEDIEDNLETLRKRSRDAYMGIPLAAGAIKTLRTNVVGSGLVPTPQVDADYLHLNEEQADHLQAEISREFSLWADSAACDASGMDNFWRLQTLAFTSFLMNGDVFAAVQFKERGNWPYALQLRLIEADQVCSPDRTDRMNPCKVDGINVHQIVQGVETDKDGAVIAYWVASRHPLAYDNPLPLTWTRVEARDKETGEPNILCVTQRERAGQRRGVPLLAPVLPTMKQMGRYTDAELAAAIVASSITLFIKHDNPVSGAPFGEDPSDKAEDPNTPPDELAINLAPSAVFDLAPGETPDTFDPKHPTTTYDGFMSAMSNQVATGIEVPSEVLYKKFSSNYSASRGSLNEFWRTCDVMRDSFAADFCQPTYEKWFAEAVARGRINAPGFFDDPAVAKAYMACNWNGPARTNLDAKKEIEAAILRMEQGISTAEQETAQMTGGSWRANMRQRKSEMEKMKEVGCNGQSQFPDEPQVNE